MQLLKDVVLAQVFSWITLSESRFRRRFLYNFFTYRKLTITIPVSDSNVYTLLCLSIPFPFLVINRVVPAMRATVHSSKSYRWVHHTGSTVLTSPSPSPL